MINFIKLFNCLIFYITQYVDNAGNTLCVEALKYFGNGRCSDQISSSPEQSSIRSHCELLCNSAVPKLNFPFMVVIEKI